MPYLTTSHVHKAITLTIPILENGAMATPVRCGRAAVHTFDQDALDMLAVLAPSKKAQGRFLSELIRQEVTRRVERQKFVDAMSVKLQPRE